MLMECFWSGLDEIVGRLMPEGESRWSLVQYIDLALWLCGSHLTVGIAEKESYTPVLTSLPEPAPVTAIFPEPAPVTAVLLVPAPVTAVLSEPAPVTAVLPEPVPVTAVLPEPAPVTAVFPEPAPVTAVFPEPAPVTAVLPEPAPRFRKASEWNKCEGVFGDADEIKSVSVTEGDHVTLYTDVNVQKDDQILWTFGPQNTRIAEIIKRDQINLIFVSNDVSFRDKLMMDNQTGSLTIRNIRSEHTGLYKLTVIISGKTSLKSFSVTVYAPLPIPVITSNSSNCSSSSERSSVSRCVLMCSVLNVSDVTLSWYKGNSLLYNISVSDLSISLSLPLEVEYQDKNPYSCVLNNPIRNHTHHLNIIQLCQPCAEHSHRSYSISVIVGVLLLVAIIAVLGAILLWYIKNHKQAPQTGKYYCNCKYLSLCLKSVYHMTSVSVYNVL
ncbi:natural killer cell receptor 2B4-like [Garra rufa]|uniref:natural killer cell receptor 2B4-like n=1 Tax=Garra rufa TaxID=137080 RepID=UPI003CCEA816